MDITVPVEPMDETLLVLSLDLSSGVFGLEDLAELGCLILFLDLMVSVFNEIGLALP